LSKILKISNDVLVLNKRNSNFLFEHYGISSTIVPNFIESSMVRTDKKIISDEIRKAIFVGYVRPEKGVRELYELARKHPEITFRLIGEIHDEVMSWIKPDNVILCGKKNHSDILSEMDQADIFVFLSHSEGFSIALLEAMSRGLPCIATEVGANQEMLEGKGGVLVPSGDVSAIIEAFEVLKDQNLRSKMSQWNVEKVRTQYNAESVMARIITIYK
jgi:glycosyltransferase involved in cell wall biosynthesis